MEKARAVWWVYIIRTEDNRLYAGVATDVVRRFREHRAGGARAARYLKAHPPRALVFSMAVGTRSQALKVEYRLKRLTRARKEALIRCRKPAFDPATGAIDL
jgi:putative endonuclease